MSRERAVRFFVLPEGMRPAVCQACGAVATVLVQQNMPGGQHWTVCQPCMDEFTSTQPPLDDAPSSPESAGSNEQKRQEK
jgi:hypothetical protein